MRTIELYIKSYIDEARKEFGKEMKDHMSALIEHVDEQMKEVVKITSARPTEERVRQIFQEEMRPFAVESRIFKAEMIALRLDVNKHEKRISKLELQVA